MREGDLIKTESIRGKTSFKTKVSIVMACYNAAEYLDQAIKSILHQTLTDFDFIIVDDASNDKTAEIIKSYAARDQRIVFCAQQENKGPALARNSGIKLARGQWIAILDSDDIALPERLENQIIAVEKESDIIMLGSDAFSIDSAGSILKRHRYPSTDAALKKRLHRIKSFPPHSSILYSTEEVKRVGGFNPRFIQSEDWDLWLRLAGNGKIACLNKPLVMLRRHTRNMSHDNRGMTQMLTGAAAVTCHFIRTKGSADPSRQGEGDWYRFVQWLSLRLDAYGFFERLQEFAQIRQIYNFSENKLQGLLQVIAHIVSSRHAPRMVRDIFQGTNLYARLADEWVKRIEMGSIA